ncbi:hypothetical protein H0H92_004204 [Tricholoma furcatifolium]|nr:hypothetical protein H0H92_004204 [Tricholoma furcatifolium]
MANTDNEPVRSQVSSEKEHNVADVQSLNGSEKVVQVLKGSEEASKTVVATDALKALSTTASNAKSSTGPVRPSLVQLGSSSSHQSSTPQPKRFSAVNINKKFLEKNSTATSSPISQPAIKAGVPAPSSTGAGWSRPSSAAPNNAPGAHSPHDSSPPLPASSLATTASPSGAPQLPHAGKVIQPQPRTATSIGNLSQKDTLVSKPVWGNPKPAATSRWTDVRDDFPTAAEVAKATHRTAKLHDTRETTPSIAPARQSRMEDADTFRGVHLDPKAHHWDEMEEDDDNFLDSVIEFGDGRQYKVDTGGKDSTFAYPESSSAVKPITTSQLDDDTPSVKDGASNLVSKEERFADDFDRSWPLSRTSPANSRDVPLPSGRGTSASPTTQDMPQEGARVLFNERLNRMEPYSNGQRSNSGQYAYKKGSWRDSSFSPTEPRSARDLPPTPQSPNVQLLQKPGDSSRFRRFSGASASSASSFSPGNQSRDRDDHSTKREGLSTAPRDNSGSRAREPYNERGRRSDMGPPPLPLHAGRGSSRDGGRQLPPHLSQIPASAPIRSDGRFSSEPRFSAHGETNGQPTRQPPQSPALSQASASRISPLVPLTSLPQLSTPEIDEARKDVMQNAAARAKQRRQLEEEQREKEKDRARRKAAELEERMRVDEAEKGRGRRETVENEEKAEEAERGAESEVFAQEKLETGTLTKLQEEVVAVIEEAVNSVQPLHGSVDSRGLRRPPSLKSLPIPSPHTSLPTPASQADSWRNKTTPRLPPVSQDKPPAPTFLAAVQIESLENASEEELEVVDFVDMDKFVGAPDASHTDPEDKTKRPYTRPVASDFFDDAVTDEISTLSAKKPKSDEARPVVTSPSTKDSGRKEGDTRPPLDSIPTSSLKPSTASLPHSNNVRTSRNQSSYKEAAMSALDDTMLRIKGALDGMQAGDGKDLSPSQPLEAYKTGQTFSGTRPKNAPKDRWMIPPLTSRDFDHFAPGERWHTSTEPPTSPKQVAILVKLPAVSYSLSTHLSKKQLPADIRSPFPVQADTLSFDPHFKTMGRRTVSINDLLFSKPIGGFRVKPKYPVRLPRFELGHRNITQLSMVAATSTGAFGRPSAADGVPTWRKLAQTQQDSGDDGTTESNAIDSSHYNMLLPDSGQSILAKSDVGLPRPRVPKMPAGSAVAFYRDSKIDAVEAEPHTSVNFIVGSELESRRASQATTPSKHFDITITPPVLANSNPESTSNAIRPQTNGVKGPSDHPSAPITSESDESVSNVFGQLQHTKLKISSQSKSASSTTHPTTPTWGRSSLPVVKDSPARGPDPDHLRAVWSQTSNKAGTHGVNSLEGIADDLTALPFTLQEVKSEDGETPPPSLSAPASRMSLHEVTKAFQQVPLSSSTSSPAHRTPPLSAPPARPPNYAYGLPPPVGTMRPGYPYPHPSMMPSPGLMYPSMMPSSPAPGRMSMNGHAPLYAQPMWMPMPAGSTPQNHATLMRPMPSPYSPHMVPYSPGPPLYGPHPPASLQNTAQQNGSQANRDRNPMISPVMPHAPVMYGSPVMMHAPSVAPGYLMPPGRSPARSDHSSIPQTTQQSHSTYTSSSSFRPW